MNPTRVLPVLLLLTIPLLAGCTDSAITTLPVDEWAAALGTTPGAFLLDVRTAQEYQDGHIANATLVPYDVLEQYPDLLPQDKDTPVFVYCRSGHRSGIASETLEGMGYTHIVNLQGGLIDWTGAGYPVVTGA